jgi:hypothetical protein
MLPATASSWWIWSPIVDKKTFLVRELQKQVHPNILDVSIFANRMVAVAHRDC